MFKLCLRVFISYFNNDYLINDNLCSLITICIYVCKELKIFKDIFKNTYNILRKLYA